MRWCLLVGQQVKKREVEYHRREWEKKGQFLVGGLQQKDYSMEEVAEHMNRGIIGLEWT